MRMKQLSLRELQLEELAVLKAFADFCDAHQIRYYLCGGTLLGAVRHKGFIPWDDDIDVLVSRPDYQKFLALTNGRMGDSFRIRQPGDKAYPYPFAKVVNPEVMMKARGEAEAQPLWIDIFPMDGLPDDEAEIIRIYQKVKRYNLYNWYAYSSPAVSNSILKRIAKQLLLWPFRIFGYSYFLKKTEQLAQRYPFDTSNFVAGITWGYGPQEKMVRAEYTALAELEFEGELFSVPGCYQAYLKGLYGNYMELPPEEKRISHVFEVWKVGD